MDEEKPQRYNRDHLRYPSDVTDDEWGLFAPLIPTAKSGGGKRRVDHPRGGQRRHVCAEHGLPVAPHPQGPAAAKHGQRLFLRFWRMTARWIASTTRSTSNVASNSNAKPAPPPASSTARASKAPKKGGLHRSAWLRRGQADQGQEAPHSRRYAGTAAARARSSPPMFRIAMAACCVLSTLFGLFPFLKKLFADSAYEGPSFTRRWRHLAGSRDRNRQTFRSRQGLCRPAQTLDRRTHDRLAQPLPPARQGLGKSQPQRPRFSALASIRLMLRKLCNP